MLRAQAHNIALLQNTLKPHRQCPALLLSPPAACHIGGCPQPRSTADRLTYTSPPPCTELHQEGLISTCILLYCSLWDAVLCNAWVPGSSNAVPAACATKMHLCSCSCILTGISELRYCSPLGIRCFAVVNGHTSLGRSSDQRSSCHRQLTLARPTSGPTALICLCAGQVEAECRHQAGAACRSLHRPWLASRGTRCRRVPCSRDNLKF